SRHRFYLNSMSRFRGTLYSALAVADFNGDGIPDLATANRRTNDVSILLGQPNAGFPLTFAAQLSFAVGNAPSDMVAADSMATRSQTS
uniref:FG-GAP repeat domain-containing protein n=1 Tax=Candidatus Entotheonella palauensis TaxID=93172 RepID=UPI001C4DE521